MEDAYSQCAQLVARFYRGLDTSDLDLLLGCVEPDTVWVRKGERLVGPSQIRQALDQRDAARVTAHLASNLIIERADADNAIADYYLTVFDNTAPAGGLQAKTVLRSTDRYALRNRVWRLVEKRSVKHL